MPKHTIYLWTLPMFHCNGWCFSWTAAVRAGVNVYLRKVEAQAIFDAMRAHGVTHHYSALIVHGLLVNSPAVMFGELPKTSTGKIQKFELRKQAGSAEAIDI